LKTLKLKKGEAPPEFNATDVYLLYYNKVVVRIPKDLLCEYIKTVLANSGS